MRRKVRNTQKSTQSLSSLLCLLWFLESFYQVGNRPKASALSSTNVLLPPMLPLLQSPSCLSLHHSGFLGELCFSHSPFRFSASTPWSNTCWFNSPYTFSEDSSPPRNQTFGTDFSKNCYLSRKLLLRLLWYGPAGSPSAGLTSSFLKVLLVYIYWHKVAFMMTFSSVLSISTPLFTHGGLFSLCFTVTLFHLHSTSNGIDFTLCQCFPISTKSNDLWPPNDC